MQLRKLAFHNFAKARVALDKSYAAGRCCNRLATDLAAVELWGVASKYHRESISRFLPVLHITPENIGTRLAQTHVDLEWGANR
jgi:hypothetical protein